MTLNFIFRNDNTDIQQFTFYQTPEFRTIKEISPTDSLNEKRIYNYSFLLTQNDKVVCKSKLYNVVEFNIYTSICV